LSSHGSVVALRRGYEDKDWGTIARACLVYSDHLRREVEGGRLVAGREGGLGVPTGYTLALVHTVRGGVGSSIARYAFIPVESYLEKKNINKGATW
jgi:hypothetical protein